MVKRSILGLAKAIYALHGCKSKWIESVPVKEIFEGETIWEGTVEVFDLEDHPTAKRAYAWSYSLGHSRKRRFFAVLHHGLVKSAQDAVRASIVEEFRNKLQKSNGNY